MWNRKGWELSHGRVHSGCTMQGRKLPSSPSGSTIHLPLPLIQSNGFKVNTPSGDSWSPPKVDKPTLVKIHHHVGSFNVRPRHWGRHNAAPLEVRKLYTSLYNTAMVRCLIFKAAGGDESHFDLQIRWCTGSSFTLFLKKQALRAIFCLFKLCTSCSASTNRALAIRWL